ncbi:hypothetical protein IGS68_06785 [Skermanella sp. TT6]|uniref:DUF1828 domain-containing protein n=1 Tax=Skermanella cutis TaxID=2775420 RepID=A0ABX7B9V8_9PROT|nr:hypothetical protein [Skermanella sp. TT6]QQP90923.1 hypothetical protein IGS68_06785 [Skermanella sp. TT6]
MNKVMPTEVERIARSLISAEETNLGIEVTTPVIYPNGNCVTVVVEQTRSGLAVHDASSGAMFLASEGIHFTRQIARRLAPLVADYGCKLDDGRVARNTDSTDLAVAIALVANASRLVADHVLEVRRQTEVEFRHAVTERLREFVGERLRENETFHGASGRVYRVANVILDAEQACPIAFIVSLASRGTVPACFSEMFDLKNAFPTVANESVYAEHGDLRPEDKAFLGQVSKVIAFGQASTEFAKFKAAV